MVCIAAVAVWLRLGAVTEVANLQVFQVDEIILTHQRERRLVGKAMASASDRKEPAASRRV
jgi:hypothetical protein